MANLGALFTHRGQSETIYSTTTIDYWAQIPGANLLHSTRYVVVLGFSSLPEESTPLAGDEATTTNATTTAQ